MRVFRFTFALLLALSAPLFGLSYSTQKSYELINLYEAYAMNPNITGKGVVVGIGDSYFDLNHPSLQNKSLAVFNNTNPKNGAHGTHVAGIVLGTKLNDNDPHGVAHEARFYGVASKSQEIGGIAFTNLYNSLADKGIKIANHSWGVSYFPLINRGFNSKDKYVIIEGSGDRLSSATYFRYLIGDQDDVVRLSREKGILNIVANGNDGAISGGLLNAVPAYDEDLRALITVGALGATNITKDSNGQITIEQGGVAYFSNLFKGMSLYGITAPGRFIEAARNGSSGFVEQSGTSMAAPIVTGAAALIQQKFGFLNGAQIADVLLSTANDKVKMPELIVQENANGKNTIIYVGREPPKTLNGEIDIKQVRTDLQRNNYSPNYANNLNSIYTNDQDIYREAIVRLEAHEIIGQGILDVEKALRGLGRLDANRLKLGDVATINGEIQGVYRLDTAGQDAEFSNDISQRLWDNKWHIEGALNSPKSELENVKKIGLEKLGGGTLTLSGNNTYEGATRVRGGEIALTGSLKGDAWALDSARFSINGGTIGGSAIAQNRGIFEIQSSAKIHGNLTAQSGAQIKLTTPQTTLSAQSVRLDSGAILSGAGTITGSLTNNGGEVRAGFLDAALGFTPNAALSIEGGYSQDSSAKLQVAFDGKNFTRFNATSYDIRGGELTLVPHASLTPLKNGQSVPLDLGNLGNHLSGFDLIKAWDSNTLHYRYNAQNKALEAWLKTEVLKPILLKNTIKLDPQISDILLEKISPLPQYYNAFVKLDYLAPSAFEREISAIYDTTTAFNESADTLKSQHKNTLGNVAYLVDSMPQNFGLTRSFGVRKLARLAALKRLVRQGDVQSDAPNAAANETISVYKNQLALDASYAIFKKKTNDFKTIAGNLQYRRIAGDRLLVGGFIDYARGNGEIEMLQTQSDRLSLGLNAIYDAANLSLIFGLNAGVGEHKNTNGAALPRTGRYRDYQFGLSFGASKGFSAGGFSLKPMWILHYAGVFQDAYREDSALFAKGYDGATHQLFASSLGAHFGYAGGGFYLGAFGFYNARYLKMGAQRAFFVDAPEQSIVFSEAGRLSHSVYFGANAQANIDRYFLRLGVSDEIGGEFSQLSANLALGVGF